MKRIFTKALCLVCAGALALSLAACGGKADSMEDGIDLARKLIDDGAAYGKLTALKEASNL